MTKDVLIRREREEDYRIVEELTRSAFWDVNVPGCDEHYLAHTLRRAEAFIAELDLVAVLQGRIVGNIMYAKAQIVSGCGESHPVLTFGPLSVWPELQKQGIGTHLVRHSLGKAYDLGYSAVIIYGDPDYYRRFGFRPARDFAIHTPFATYSPALQALELQQGALNGISGAFEEGEAYHFDSAAASAFDKDFAPREKGYRDSQRRFQELLAASLPI